MTFVRQHVSICLAFSTEEQLTKLYTVNKVLWEKGVLTFWSCLQFPKQRQSLDKEETTRTNFPPCKILLEEMPRKSALVQEVKRPGFSLINNSNYRALVQSVRCLFPIHGKGCPTSVLSFLSLSYIKTPNPLGTALIQTTAW